MDTNRLQNEIEKSIIRMISKDELFKFDYSDRINLSDELKKAYSLINHERVFSLITKNLEEKIAEKVVAKIITEMGTDIKKLMAKEEIRDDFRFLLRKGVEDILSKIRD